MPYEPRPGVRVTDHMVEVTNEQVLADTIAALEAGGEGYRVPLFQGTIANRFGFSMASHGTAFPAQLLERTKPTVLLLLDDHPGATGPKGWQQAVKLLRWADRAVFHATGGQRWHYELIGKLAEAHGRILVVEMEFRHHPDWLALAARIVPRLPILNLLPTNGQHPVAPPKEQVQ